MATATKAEKERDAKEALELLHRFIKPGQRIYTSLTHVSSTGMSRRIRVYAVTQYGKGSEPNIWDCTRAVAKACGFRYNSDKQALVVGGCGMDMGFHVVYSLSRTMFPDGAQCIGEKCPSNDHVNGDRDYTPHRHSDGGYTLSHSWL